MSESLSEEEIRALKKLAKSAEAIQAIVESEARVAWLWASARIIATWVSAAIVGAYALYEIGIKVLRGSP